MRKAFVKVQKVDGKIEWRMFTAETLDDAFNVAIQQTDVDRVLESTWEPGGVVT